MDLAGSSDLVVAAAVEDIVAEGCKDACVADARVTSTARDTTGN